MSNSNRVDRLYDLWPYTKSDGTFDYEKYREVQIAANLRKKDRVWALRPNIAFLSEYIRARVPSVRFGLCHGTRSGKEQEWFAEDLGCEVLGTEISPAAATIPRTIVWDFHEAKPEWIGNVDFIYSNSFDHTYDPERCLNTWMRCLSSNGVCILEHSTGHVGAKETDPFGAPLHVMPFLALQFGRGKYAVHEILRAPETTKMDGVEFEAAFLVLKNNSW